MKPCKATVDDALDAQVRLVDRLFEGLLGDEPWMAFLDELRRQLEGNFATLILTRPNAKRPGVLLAPGGDTEEIQTYIDQFFEADPFTSLPEGRVVTLHEFISERRLVDSSYYQQFLSNAQGYYTLGVDLRGSTGFEARLRISRGADSRDFEESARRYVQRLVGPLRHALLLYERLEMSRSEYSVYSGAVEQLSVGTIILDHTNRVVNFNAVAGAILNEQDGLTLVGRKLALGDAALDAAFRRLLAQARSQDNMSPPQAMAVPRSPGRRDLGLVAKPISTPSFMQTGTAPAIALFVSDPDRRIAVTGDALRARFSLTRMEALVAAYLANGFTLADTAEALGIATSTARTHLNAAFAKTGAKQQSQLVHLIHTSLPDLAGSPAALPH